MVDAFPTRGNIDPQTFPFTLADLHRRGATGSLKVEGPAYPKALYFRAGRVLFGSSNDPRDQLGAILIENGKLTQEQLDEVNGKVGPGNPLAKILSDSGFVSQRELSEAARTKVERILADVVAYTSGSFEFEDGVLPKGAVDLKLATERLVIASIRRIADRAFVVRHLGGMETTLEPTSSLAGAAAEIRSETGGLLDQLDGRTPLNTAAAAARMDDFEAAKVGCALLFLGLAKRGPAASVAELDLAATAQMAFGGLTESEDEPFFVADEPAELSPAPSDPFVLPPVPATNEAAPAEAFVLPASPSEASPFVLPATRTPKEPPPAPIAHRAPQPLPAAAPTEEDVPPDIFRASAASALPPSPRPFEIETVPTGFIPDPYLVPPDGSLSVPTTAAPGPSFDDGPEPPPPSRPSKEDLAALDALLNPVGGRPVGVGPKAARPRAKTEWEPQFQVGARPPARGGARQGPSRLLVALAAVAAIGLGGGAWHYLVGIPGVPPLPGSRPAPTPMPVVTPPPAQEPTPVPTLPPIAPSPSTELPQTPNAEATPGPITGPGTPDPVPTPFPTGEAPGPPPAVPPSQTPARDLAGARRLLASGDFPVAARSFEAVLHTDAHRRFTIQVLVACVPETVLKAVAQVPGDELLLFSASINGRSCYRMTWGLYDTDAEARAAVGTVPAYFRSGGSPKPQKLSNLFK